MPLPTYLDDPNVAGALLLVGIFGLLLEASHPGTVLPGVTGAFALILALVSLRVLDYAGFAVILLGLGLLVAEVWAPTCGVLGAGGVAALVLGSALVLETGAPGFHIGLGLIAGAAVAGAPLLGLARTLVMRARRAPIVTGDGLLLGADAVTLEPLEREGWVLVQGERWHAQSRFPVAAGSHVRVTGLQGLTLMIEPEANAK
jgi:membrane-bound serine protease (ClpP class)